MTTRHGGRGYTLVEVLVALFAMAVLASLAWQGLSGILRARDVTRDAIDATVRLATVMTQWEQDLQAIHDTGIVPAIAFDGQTLRLTRRAGDGVALVAWALRGGVWQRWVGPPAKRSDELQQLWLNSFQFLGNEPGQLVVADDARTWQVYFNRGGSWTNAQSTGDVIRAPMPVVAAPPASSASVAGDGAAPAPAPVAVQPREVLPIAVRLVVDFAAGTLTRDVAIGPGAP